MGLFTAECPDCGKETEFEVNSINELPKTVFCKCGLRYAVTKLPLK